MRPLLEVAEIETGACGIWLKLRGGNKNKFQKPLKVIRTTELKEILVISCWQKTVFWQSFWYHLLSLCASCEIKDAFSRVVTWTLAMIYISVWSKSQNSIRKLTLCKWPLIFRMIFWRIDQCVYINREKELNVGVFSSVY